MKSDWVDGNSRYMLCRMAAMVAAEIKCSIIGDEPEIAIANLPGDNGRFYYDDNVIKLDSSLSPYHQRSTLAHELAHYCGIESEEAADIIGFKVAIKDYVERRII